MSNKTHAIFLLAKFHSFRNFIVGSTLSDIGNQMQNLAISWQVYQLTHSAASLGLIGLFTVAPLLSFSLFGGLVADKVNRKKLLLLAQFVLGTLAVILYWMTITNQVNVGVIYALLAINATIMCFVVPTQQSVIPSLVPDEFLGKAVSLRSLFFQSSDLLSPMLAGIIIASFGVSAIYFINVLSFMPFIVLLWLTHIPLHPKKNEITFSFGAIREGLHFVRTTPILVSTMLLDFSATFFGTAKILMPIFATDVFHVGAQGLGFLYAAPTIGGLLAGLTLSTIHKLRSPGKIIIWALIAYGVATVGFGLSKWFGLSLVFLVISGFGYTLSSIIRNTIRQMITPPHLRGRMISVMRIFFQGGPQLGNVEAGYLAAAIGTPISVVVGGIGTIIITLIIAKQIPALIKYNADDIDKDL